MLPIFRSFCMEEDDTSFGYRNDHDEVGKVVWSWIFRVFINLSDNNSMKTNMVLLEIKWVSLIITAGSLLLLLVLWRSRWSGRRL